MAVTKNFKVAVELFLLALSFEEIGSALRNFETNQLVDERWVHAFWSSW